jgi:hypothetical protein
LIAVVPVQEEEADLQAADIAAVGYYPESYFDGAVRSCGGKA